MKSQSTPLTPTDSADVVIHRLRTRLREDGTMSVEQLSDSLESLNNHQVSLQKHPAELQLGLIQAFLHHTHDMGHRERFKILGDFLHLQMKPSHALETTLITYFEEHKAAAPTHLLWLVAKLGMKWVRLDPRLAYEFESALICHFPHSMTARDTAQTLWAFATMGHNWSSLSTRLQRGFVSALCRNGPHLNCQDIAISIWGLARLKADWATISSELHDVFIKAIHRMAPIMHAQTIANTLWGLANLRLRHTEKANTALARVVDQAKHYRLSSVERSQVRISHFGLTRDGFFLPPLEGSLAIKPKSTCSQSILERKICAQFKAASSHAIEEEYVLCGFAVDMFIPEHNLALQLDGSSHTHSKRHQTDAFCDQLLADYGYTVIRIDSYKWERACDDAHDHFLDTIESGNLASLPESPSFIKTHLLPTTSRVKPHHAADKRLTVVFPPKEESPHPKPDTVADEPWEEVMITTLLPSAEELPEPLNTPPEAPSLLPTGTRSLSFFESSKRDLPHEAGQSSDAFSVTLKSAVIPT